MFSSIVLAGGKALRLGRDKLQEEVDGKTLLARVLGTLSSLAGDVIIVAGVGQPLPTGSAGSKVKIVTDVFPDGGPLGGIYTGLAASDSFHNLVVAGDMPFLNLPLLRYLLENAGDFDVVIPRLNSFIEPLHAVYSQRCLPYIKREIESGRRNIRSFFPLVKVRYIERQEIVRFDPECLSFFNINNEDDLKRAWKLSNGIK